ncbi:hypothetical protein HPP92_015463 [Vanilla planifolia]|uniref:Folate-biopterin transporter 2 n=1 Tax=Vanilla planifolia TaxID=51239 RepID=A0A835UVQ3_VANPL|nr:hypothetical protein HPP92_015463 [Vanilla planifolia]
MESSNKERLVEKEGENEDFRGHKPKWRLLLLHPLGWFQALLKEMHWTFIYAVIATNGISQGLGGAVSRVASDYYWKDVQSVLPSESQVYQGITSIPWLIKPLWGLLTDVLPIAGYRRKPYFILAGLVGAISMLFLWLQNKLCSGFALLLFTAASAGVAMADVTVDACVAQNSISHPALAAKMQSLCGLSSSLGGLLGFFLSGFLMDAIGSKGVLGMLSFPAALVISVGWTLREQQEADFSYAQLYEKLTQAKKTMWATLKCAEVWKPCIFVFTSLALSLNIQEGLFYWYTDTKSGPCFSQRTISFIYAMSSVGSLLGVLLYQNSLKDYPFRVLLFWTQLLSCFAGMLDLMQVLHVNLMLGIGDQVFAVMGEGVSQMVGRVKWMPILVLSSKLCPMGVEGTFFALLMSIDHVGLLVSSWGGGLLLQLLRVSRTEFGGLWIAVLVRNLLRLLPLLFVGLVPKSDQRSAILKADACVRGDLEQDSGTLY